MEEHTTTAPPPDCGLLLARLRGAVHEARPSRQVVRAAWGRGKRRPR
jgi:hypothetical protein